MPSRPKMNAPSALLIFSFATVVVAGYVRGYGGFGFSMITVAALSLFFAPVQVVPVVLLLEGIRYWKHSRMLWMKKV